MALLGDLCITINAVAGFTNRSLRAQIAVLLATTYASSQITYDLRRLRRKGLIQRVPRTNTYALTPDGLRVAVFYTKLVHVSAAIARRRASTGRTRSTASAARY